MAYCPRVVGQRGFVAITQPACPVVHSKASLSSLFAVILPTRWAAGTLLAARSGRLLADLEPYRYSLSPVLRAQRVWPGLKVGYIPPALAALGGGCGAFERGKLGLAPQDTKLIAFGIDQDHPAGAVLVAQISDLSSTEGQDPLDLFIARAVDGPQVEMNPVLHLFRFGHLDEQHLSPAVSGDDQAFLITGFVGIVRILRHVQNLGPPHRLRVGVTGIDRCVADARSHARQHVSRMPAAGGWPTVGLAG
jgi:hypothetical protein